MQHLSSDVNLFRKTPSFINYNSSVANISYSTRITMCFYFFPQLFSSSIFSLLKSSFINMFVPFSLFAFFKIFALSLYLRRLHITVSGLLPLIVLFCLFDVRCARSISIGHSKPSFSWNTCCNFSSQSSHVSPRVPRIPSTLRLFLLIYPLDLLPSARHIPDQSDSHISLQFGVRYLLVYVQDCSLFLPVGSL